MLTFVLLKGWGFTAEVIMPLRDALQKHFPDAQYAIPTQYCSSIHHDGDIQEWRDQWLPREALSSPDARVCYLGWSLGGLLASRLAALPDARTATLITLGTNLRFVADDHWPCAMPPHDFKGFAQVWQRRPQDTLRHFARMALQGCSNPRALRAMMDDWLDFTLPIDDGQRQLGWLQSTDLSPYWTNKQYSYHHFFAAHDALVPCTAAAELAARGIQSDVLNDAGHLLPVTHAEHIARQIADLLKDGADA